MDRTRSRKLKEIWLTFPSFSWLFIFFVIPTVIILATAFRQADPFGGIGSSWTLKTIMELGNPNYPVIAWRTFWLSAMATAICILISVPAGYYIARMEKNKRDWILLMIIVPFWVNFLIRIFAWKVLLHPDGVVKHVLAALSLVPSDAMLLYNPWAVLVVLVYSYLPFSLLPIYAAAEKFDYSLIHAAQDLGATKITAFRKVFLPGIKDGLFAAVIVVFIPALGSYIIPEIVGGTSSDMIGNKIAQRTFIDRNLPHASALSAILMMAVIIPVTSYIILQSKKESGFRKGFK